MLQIIPNGMEEILGNAEIGVEPVQLLHENYLAVLTEKPALDQADDGGDTGLGRVLHGTLLAGCCSPLNCNADRLGCVLWS